MDAHSSEAINWAMCSMLTALQRVGTDRARRAQDRMSPGRVIHTQEGSPDMGREVPRVMLGAEVFIGLAACGDRLGHSRRRLTCLISPMTGLPWWSNGPAGLTGRMTGAMMEGSQRGNPPCWAPNGYGTQKGTLLGYRIRIFELRNGFRLGSNPRPLRFS
jgi:hypothetical protein